MPWGHAAVGYVLYSLGCRAAGREPPSGAETLTLLFATQFPDFVDKPLSWELDLFTTGHAVAHSVFVALPLGVALLGVAINLGRRQLGVAFLVGYWSHLLADVMGPVQQGHAPDLNPVFWPIADPTGYETEYGLRRGLVYVGTYVDSLTSADPLTVVAAAAIPLLALLVWLLDGAPGVAGARRYLRAVT